jgi:hypothetical protein
LLVALSSRDHYGYGLPFAFSAQVDLGGESSPAYSKGFLLF